MAPVRLILASRSDRRAQLLRQGGYEFDQLPPPFDDPPWPVESTGSSVETLAVDLAANKALSLLKTLDLDLSIPAVILAGDTVCVDSGGRLIGQPSDGDHARQMIDSFVSASHRVITGVALVDGDRPQPAKLVDAAVVSFGQIQAADVEAYVAAGGWRGKAGGYNLFERLDHGWPITVTGDPTTVVVPTSKATP